LQCQFYGALTVLHHLYLTIHAQVIITHTHYFRNSSLRYNTLLYDTITALYITLRHITLHHTSRLPPIPITLFSMSSSSSSSSSGSSSSSSSASGKSSGSRSAPPQQPDVAEAKVADDAMDEVDTDDEHGSNGGYVSSGSGDAPAQRASVTTTTPLTSLTTSPAVASCHPASLLKTTSSPIRLYCAQPSTGTAKPWSTCCIPITSLPECLLVTRTVTTLAPIYT
jgi:hypothetical protein